MYGPPDSVLMPRGIQHHEPQVDWLETVVLPQPSPQPVEPFQSAVREAKVWILDDDGELCRSLARQFTATGWLPLSIHHPREFERLLSEAYPDVLVMEQLLPGQTGSDILTDLRAIGHRFPVLMLSALGEPHDRIRGLEAGADDYVCKPFTARELLLRLELLLQKSSLAVSPILVPEEAFQLGPLRFDPADFLLTHGEESVTLNRGDTLLMLAFCQCPTLIITREQLARASGSTVDARNSRSLDMRISKLRRQLNGLCPGMGEQLQSVRGRGYRFNTEIIRIAPVH